MKIAQLLEHGCAAVGDQDARVGHEKGMTRTPEPRGYDRVGDMIESRRLDQHSRQLVVRSFDGHGHDEGREVRGASNLDLHAIRTARHDIREVLAIAVPISRSVIAARQIPARQIRGMQQVGPGQQRREACHGAPLSLRAHGAHRPLVRRELQDGEIEAHPVINLLHRKVGKELETLPCLGLAIGDHALALELPEGGER